MSGRTFKRCGCRDEQGKQLGARCPRLGQKKHGAWTYVVDVHGADGKRKQHKRGGFRTKAEAELACDEIVGVTRRGQSVDDKITVANWLDRWLDGKTAASGISSVGKSIRSSTEAGYRQHVRDYLKPHLGHIVLSRLTADDISMAYDKIMTEANAKTAKASVHNQPLVPVDARAGRPASVRRIHVRVAGPTTLRRVNACLRAALNAAVKSRRLPYNPALGVELPAENKQPVQPWEAHELGAFLDFVQNNRLAALFELLAASGLRRGEALGLAWTDIDAARGTLTVRRQLLNAWHDGAPVFGPPKTATGKRVIELDTGTMGTLLAHRLAQDVERAAWGSAYDDHGLIFTQENGRPVDPSKITKIFSTLCAEAGLRHIRLHDLRHGSASLMLAAGIPVEVVSKRLGHSSIGVTMDTYSHLLDGVGRRAAEAAMGLVPRATRKDSRDHNVTTTSQDKGKSIVADLEKSHLTSADDGAPGGIRTPNLLIRSQMLYPLSYGCLLSVTASRRRTAP